MIGDDACSTFVELLKKLLDIIGNIERERRKGAGAREVHIPKIKVGSLSKSAFNKLNKSGVDFKYVTVPADKQAEIEEAVKKMGGSYFDAHFGDSNNRVMAVPANQLDLLNTALKHVVAQELADNTDKLKIKDGFNEEVKEADRALYEAKETGRNKVVSADEHTYMSYLASKAIDVFIESEGLTDISAIDDVSEMIIDTFLNPTEEQDLHTIADALRAYAEQGEGELSETAYFTADKMDELADRLNIPYTEERKIETEEISAGEAEKGISEADRTGNSESKVRSADDLQKQVPEKSEKVKSGKPTLAETLKSIKGWADKVHIAVMEKDKAKEQDKNKNGGER